MRFGLSARLVWFAFLGVALTTAPGVAADRDFAARLNGDYAMVQTRVCSQGTPGAAGINENLVLLSPNTLRTTAVRGLMTFDGHGGGVAHIEELQLNAGITATGQQQTGGSVSICDLSYTVDDGGRAVVNFVGCTTTGVSGGVKDMHFTASDISLDGHLSSDDKTLLLSDVAAPVTTVRTVETSLDTRRVCSRTGTAVRVR